MEHIPKSRRLQINQPDSGEEEKEPRKKPHCSILRNGAGLGVSKTDCAQRRWQKSLVFKLKNEELSVDQTAVSGKNPKSITI